MSQGCVVQRLFSFLATPVALAGLVHLPRPPPGHARGAPGARPGHALGWPPREGKGVRASRGMPLASQSHIERSRLGWDCVAGAFLGRVQGCVTKIRRRTKQLNFARHPPNLAGSPQHSNKSAAAFLRSQGWQPECEDACSGLLGKSRVRPRLGGFLQRFVREVRSMPLASPKSC